LTSCTDDTDISQFSVERNYYGDGGNGGGNNDCANPFLDSSVRGLIEEEGITPFEKPGPIRSELVVLGRMLFHDKILSGSKTVSCGTCHSPALGLGDARPLFSGVRGHGLGPSRVDGQVGGRHSQGIFNLHALDILTIDGKVDQGDDGVLGLGLDVILPQFQEPFEEFPGVAAPKLVSAQAMLPEVTFGEMLGFPGADPNNEIAACVTPGTPLPNVFECAWGRYMDRLGAIPEYVELFEDAYDAPFESLNFGHVGNAIAAYEIAAFSFNNSPWDQFVAGDDCAMTPTQLRGARQFLDSERSNCVSCHSGNAFTDSDFHQTLAPTFGCGNDLPKRNGPDGFDDFGRPRNIYANEWVFGGAGDEIFPVEERYMWRTAPLRNVEFTAPYGRLGQHATLASHVAHYSDPVAALINYDITQLPDDPIDDYSGFPCGHDSLHDSLLDNSDEILTAGIDPLLDDVEVSNVFQLIRLIAFLRSLSDENAHPDVLGQSIPGSVPSGLPVDAP